MIPQSLIQREFMKELVDNQLTIELSEEQSSKIALLTGVRQSEFVVTPTLLALFIAASTEHDPQNTSLLLCSSMKIIKMMKERGYQGLKEECFTISLDTTQAQREQIRAVTGREISSFILVPDEYKITYHEEWNKSFQSIRASRSFVIVPSAQSFQGGQGQHAIILEPESSEAAKVFGTGMHATTRMCLTALETTIQPGQRVLDLGTGSGVLAIAAARLGAGRVLALDIDALAIAATRKNIVANGLESVISAEVGSLSDVSDPPYDVVIGNLLPKIIISMIPDLARVLHDRSILIFSGIPTARCDDLVSRLSEAGFHLKEQRAAEMWSGIVVEKS